MDSFIQSVHSHPCLWNPECKDYRDPMKKDAAWQDIVENIDIPFITNIGTAKSEWKKLRDNHRDSLKRFIQSGKSGQRTGGNMWRHAESMEFLVPFMKYRGKDYTVSEAIDSLEYQLHPDSDVSILPDNDEDEDEDSKARSSPEDVKPITTRQFPKIKRNKRKCTEETVKEEDESTIKPTISFSTEELDTVVGRELIRHPLDAFFEFTCETVKQMPHWMQNKVKRKIFAVLTEAEDQLNPLNI